MRKTKGELIPKVCETCGRKRKVLPRTRTCPYCMGELVEVKKK